MIQIVVLIAFGVLGLTCMICKFCGVEIKWPEPYMKGAKPLNMDGTAHNCIKEKETESQSQEGIQKTAHNVLLQKETQEILEYLLDLVKADRS